MLPHMVEGILFNVNGFCKTLYVPMPFNQDVEIARTVNDYQNYWVHHVINCQGIDSFYIAEVFRGKNWYIKLKSTYFCQWLTQNHHINSMTPHIEKSMTCRSAKLCNAQTEQVHEPHLNNTHTTLKTQSLTYTCVVL